MRKGLIITTNDQKSTGPIEPQKLNIITSAIIPNAAPQPEPKGTDLSKMITTHDLEDKVEVKLDEPILLDESEPEPKKKAGRPKKEK